MGQNKCITDVRVIHLYRQQQLKSAESAHPPIPGDWIALGHFDRISIDLIKQEDKVDLRSIRDTNQKISKQARDYYDQPIYIMQNIPTQDMSEEKSRKRIDQINYFWDGFKSSFLLISRIHSAAFAQASFEESINNCLKQPVGHVHPVSARSEAYEPCTWESAGMVPYLYYRTLEFSDIILIAKSNSVESLLKMIGQLYYLSDVGDIYSYFGVSASALQEQDYTRASTCDSDIIPITMMRFAVHNARAASSYLKSFRNKIKKQIPGLCSKIKDPIMITGMEDLMLISENLHSRDLIIFLQNLLPGYSPNTTDETEQKAPDFWDAFDGMTTRLSIHENAVAPIVQDNSLPEPLEDLKKDNPSKDNSSDVLIENYSKLKNNFFDFYKHYNLEGANDPPCPDWLRPTAELIKSLSSISNDYILRQVCYTVLDGVQAAIQLGNRVLQLDHQHTLRQDVQKMLQKTSNGIASLMEQMVRMEGELVHNPETRPLMYDIPANLLELYLSFSDLCLDFLQKREWTGSTPTSQEKNKRFLLLLVPCLRSNISVSNLISDRNYRYTYLYIDFPIHLLYQPEFVLRSLTHEVAHFSSEKTRLRDLRFQMLTYGVAAHLLHLFPRLDRKEKLETQWLKLQEQVPADKQQYSSELTKELIRIADDTIQYTRECHRLLTCPDDRNYIHDVIRELDYLFKEGYADLVMISLLNLEKEEYIEVLVRDQSDWNDAMRASAVERAASVLIAVRQVMTGRLQEEDNDEPLISFDESKYVPCIKGFVDDINNYRKWFHNRKMVSRPRQYHRFEAIDALVNYLAECFKLIKKFDKLHEDELKQIKDYYDSFARANLFASSKFFCFLEDHRKKLLEKHKELLKNFQASS